MPGAVYWVAAGRIVRSARTGEVTDMAYAPDGSLIVAVSGGSVDAPVVWRYGAAGERTRVAGIVGRSGHSGDGAPAARALLECPWGVDVDSVGAILIADGCALRIRRVSTDGLIDTVAGTRGSGPIIEGVPARQTPLSQPEDVAVLPTGGFAILEWPTDDAAGARIRVVDPAGIIRTRGLARASSLHATADGSLLLAQGLLGDRDSALVTVITPDGTVRPVLYGHDRLGVERLLPVAGDPFAADIVWPADAVEAPDGGLLVTVDWGVQYVPPAQPRLFAVAIRPATRVPRSRLTVALRLTQAAEVQIGIWRRGRRVAAALGQLPAGEAAAAVRAHIPPGLYTVRARATAGGQVAAAEADVLVAACSRWRSRATSSRAARSSSASSRTRSARRSPADASVAGASSAG
jgi:hypothetical protein